ncbi:leucine-rich repeat neuronal protein 4 [Dendropsophus ebraccatus]|uniref:leucine-rich repeat neuronal protein 4 n=1 Tax=Dendropsophus ebraccatus TaxID=150705 RepID=UPI0038312FAC
MFALLLLISKMGMFAALLNTTDRTVTVSKNLTEPLNITDTPCGEQCNVICHLQHKNLDVLPTCLPTTIEHLDLSFNNITVIEDQDVVDLHNLRNLTLANNQIGEIYWRIHVLGKLVSLDLSCNLLSRLPSCLMLKNLKYLSLAGNPIVHIQPSAFSSFPYLLSLNLSRTLIGTNSSVDIDDPLFNATEAQEESLKSLQILDLSGTYLTNVNHSWIKKLSNLTELYMRNMILMEALEDDLITWFPQLGYLNCSNSRRLSYIRMEMFENATRTVELDLQNCNIREISSPNAMPEALSIDLHGNPLLCNCEFDVKILTSKNVLLLRPSEVFCTYMKGDVPATPLLDLKDQCNPSQSQPNNETQDSVTSSTAVMQSAFISGTTKDSLDSTLTPHTIGHQYSLLENTTDLTTKVFEKDSTTSVSLTESGIATRNTSTEMNSDLDPKELTWSFSANTERPSTEHKFPESGSSRGDQYDIVTDYQEGLDEEENPLIQTTARSKMKACDYDHCRHLQPPCSELQLLTPCMCPGLSGDDTIPDPPHVQGAFEITDTSAQILWCSPNSMVEKYQLVYQPESGTNETVDNIYVTMRQYTLYNLLPYTTYKVCVLAYNKKGHSTSTNGVSRAPCAEFTTRPSYILILSILSALGGLFLVTIIVLASCLYKARKNNIGSKYDTHLVSYKNPAFEYQCTIPSYH